MRSQNKWTGMVVGVVVGVLFSAAVVLAGSLEPRAGATQASLQGNSSGYLPIVLKAGSSSSAGVPRTGQTLCYDSFGDVIPCAGTGQDGDLKKGVVWPNPRFTDNNNGTVTDNLTGLIWLKDASFFSARNWKNALTACNTLAANGTTLTDGSVAGDWRLPNRRELFSLIDDNNAIPALPTGHPFINVRSNEYWSSTTYTDLPTGAWIMYLPNGFISNVSKTTMQYVWPVRGGQ
jgi:hypothetical protein